MWLAAPTTQTDNAKPNVNSRGIEFGFSDSRFWLRPVFSVKKAAAITHATSAEPRKECSSVR